MLTMHLMLQFHSCVKQVFSVYGFVYREQRQKTYLRTYAPSEDSDQPAHSLVSSLWAFWIAKDARCLLADNEDSDKIAQMRMLIWVSVLRTCQKERWLTLWIRYEPAHDKNNKMACAPSQDSDQHESSLGHMPFVGFVMRYLIYVYHEENSNLPDSMNKTSFICLSKCGDIFINMHEQT